MPGALIQTKTSTLPTLLKSNLTASHLKIIEGIQTGGSGSVYLAEHVLTGKQVAVKMIPFRSKGAKERFIIESEIALRLSKHETIVTTTSCFTDGSCGCLIMEAMSNDLLEILPDIQSENQLKKIFQQVVQAVSECHNNSVAHLDIKPENILLDSAGNAKLCDFGFACSFDTELKHRTGTILYNAPEVNEQNSFDKAAADIWSLGILLYVILTGNFPFPGDTEEEVILNKDLNRLYFDDLSHENRSVEAEDLVRSILQIHPAKRPTADEILSHPWFLL